MPLTDPDLIQLLLKTANALDEEGAFLIDADVDDYGRSKPSIPARDRSYFEAVTDQAQAIRDLVEMIRERQKG